MMMEIRRLSLRAFMLSSHEFSDLPATCIVGYFGVLYTEQLSRDDTSLPVGRRVK